MCMSRYSAHEWAQRRRLQEDVYSVCLLISILFSHGSIFVCCRENYETVPERVALSSMYIRSAEPGICNSHEGGAQFDSLHFADGTLKNQSAPTSWTAITRSTKTLLREDFFSGHSGEACRSRFVSFFCLIQVSEKKQMSDPFLVLLLCPNSVFTVVSHSKRVLLLLGGDIQSNPGLVSAEMESILF